MKSKQISRNAKVLPENSCPLCGTLMKNTRGSLKFPVNGVEISVSESPHLRCSKCKEVILRLDEARKLRERAVLLPFMPFQIEALSRPLPIRPLSPSERMAHP